MRELIRAYCLECSLAAGAVVISGMNDPGHYYSDACTDDCPCCIDETHHILHGRPQ